MVRPRSGSAHAAAVRSHAKAHTIFGHMPISSEGPEGLMITVGFDGPQCDP
jgi:hypothetical protein